MCVKISSNKYNHCHIDYTKVFYIMNARHPENVSIYAFKHLYLFFKASFFLQTETTNTRSLLFIAYHF